MTAEAYLKEIEAHKGIVFKIINLYADDVEDRKDLYQEIIYQSWNAYGRFLGNAKFSTWLYKISLNVALTYLKKQKKIAHIRATKEIEDRFEPPELSERADRLYRSIRQLTEIDRGLILLHLDGFSNEEISEINGLSKNNVSVKLHRIKQQLTQILNKN